MKHMVKRSVMTGLAALAASHAAKASEVLVTADISTSTTWTADNTYNLQQQIYVLPGATLTIEAGTRVISTTNLGGSLAVTKGAQIFAQGTKNEPILFTSKADEATWVGGNPATGAWREAANEWGNLTIMGAGYISENATVGNTPTPNASNVAAMEGLIAGFAGDTKVLYGGGNDDDDSGSISYCSLRYGGKVVNLNNELNGLSLGGIGRETDIHHVEIMNNVDDGVEIWGGTVNLHHLSVWNVGDDSVDIDQGWRGKIQFPFIVQGYSVNASQGSGVGDNCFETDGAEDSDWQPVTTGVIYNATVVGQPLDGDHAMAFRDNARIQYRNCIFMDIGEEVVKFDNTDGDGGSGYGHNGTLSWASTWTTDWNNYSGVNAPANPADFYKAQVDGKLIGITDSVFFRNLHSKAYTEANARSVFDPANNNVQLTSSLDVDSPLTTVTRGSLVVKGGKNMLPVTYLDPRPKNEALNSVAYAPEDGFFDSARYRGAFQPDLNWLCGWTASQAYGFTPADCDWTDVGYALKGANGDPLLTGVGGVIAGGTVTFNVRDALANAVSFVVVGQAQVPFPFKGGTMVPRLDIVIFGLVTDGAGQVSIDADWPDDAPSGSEVYVQLWIVDPAGPKRNASTNALLAVTQ